MEGYTTCTITHAVSGGGVTEETSTVLLEELPPEISLVNKTENVNYSNRSAVNDKN